MVANIVLGTPPTNPLRFSPGVEVVAPDENEAIAGLVDTLRSITETTSKDYGRTVRAVHAKSTGLVKGEFRILDNLPPVLAQGLFARPGKLSMFMRFSTSPGDLIADSISSPRGVAVKVIGVSDRGVSSETVGAQDFVMINGPAFIAPTPEAFLGSLKLLAKTTDKAEGAKKILSAALRGAESVLEAFGGESGTLKALGGHPITHPLGEIYFTQTPFRFGDYIGKFALTPVSADLNALADKHLDLNGDDNGLRAAMVEFFSKHFGEWELSVQLCTDLDAMPIEDPSVPWPMEMSPYVPVARVRAEPQSAWNEDRVKEMDEGLSFSPWHCLSAHQPLGGINRARKPAYDMSANFRGARSGCPFHDARAAQQIA